MKTAEQKAKEYAEEAIPALYSDSELMQDFVQKQKKYAKVDFLAGYNEAMRWRDTKEELPEENTQVMIKGGILKQEVWSDSENLHCTGYYYDGVWYVSPTDYYPIEIENPTGWRPIE